MFRSLRCALLKCLNISFQLLFKAGVQALPALQAELALQYTRKL